MKFTMLLVVFIIVGLLGASAVINCGFFFDRETSGSGIHSSWHEYVLVVGLILMMFLVVFAVDEYDLAPRHIAVAMSLITMAAFWVCVRLGWTLLGHSQLMSTGNAGLLIPGQTEGLIWIYLNLLSNLLLLITGFYTLSYLKKLGALRVAGFCGLLYLLWLWGWPLPIIMMIILIIIAICLGIGILKCLRWIGKLPGLSRDKSKAK